MIQVPAPVAGRADGVVARICVRVAHGVPLIAAGINAILSRSGEFEVVAGRSHSMTDVLIADIDAALRAIENGGISCNVLVVTQDDGEAVVRSALERGVRGFLLHTCEAEELTTAVRTISRGSTAFGTSVANRIVQSFASEQLTERELEVLHLMMHGSSNKDMARKLSIALGTVKTHVKSILMKLGASRRTEAAAIAQRRGIARLDSPLAAAVFFNAPPAPSRAAEHVRAR